MRHSDDSDRRNSAQLAADGNVAKYADPADDIGTSDHDMQYLMFTK